METSTPVDAWPQAPEQGQIAALPHWHQVKAGAIGNRTGRGRAALCPYRPPACADGASTRVDARPQALRACLETTKDTKGLQWFSDRLSGGKHPLAGPRPGLAVAFSPPFPAHN